MRHEPSQEQDPEENLVSRTVPPFRPWDLQTSRVFTAQYSPCFALLTDRKTDRSPYIYAARSSQLTPPHFFLQF